jgi:hypothetical protein
MTTTTLRSIAKTLDRRSTIGPKKSDQFKLLKEGGFFIPPVGTVENVMDRFWEAEECYTRYVVAYEDEMAHAGNGKFLLCGHDLKNLTMENNEEINRKRGLFCSAFVGFPFAKQSSSLRRLQVGPHVFWIEYRSNDSWMANIGDGSCEIVGVEKDSGFHPFFKHPLFAIDFVLGKEMYAVDFNLAPGVWGTGIENHLSPSAVVAALEMEIK